MKLRKEYIVLAIVMVALALYLVFHDTDGIHYQLPDVPKISGKNISKVEIGKSGGAIVLNKKDDTWYIGPKAYPADAEKVHSMINVIEKLTVTALVSESKNYARYDLNDDKKITVKSWAGSALSSEFDIGKTAATYQHTFIRLAGDPNVYHAAGNFRYQFDQTIDKLREMTVLSFDQNAIQEIQITKDKKTIMFSQKMVPVAGGEKKDKDIKPFPEEDTETIWQTVEGESMDKAQLMGLLSVLSGLACEKYIDDIPKEDFKNPVYSIHLKGAKEYSLSIFAKTDKNTKNYPGISSENGYHFLLSDSQVDRIKAIIDEILKTQAKT